MTSGGIPEERRPPPALPANEGRWSFELRGDELAGVRYDGVTLLRAVRAVVRDEDWNSVPVTVVGRRLERRPDGWTAALGLSFRSSRDDGPVDYDGDLVVSVAGDDLAVSFSGTARSVFRRNRIGLVVLHPVTEAGLPVEVVSTDGSVETSAWPDAISAHQPFRDVRGFRWEREGVRAEVALEGDMFETEDQRNWTDASFKTYSTPLVLPFPVEVRPGDHVRQAVRLHAAGRALRPPATASARPSAATSVVVLDEVAGVVPAISLGTSTTGAAVPAWAKTSSGFEAVLVELTGSAHEWPAVLASAEREAVAFGARLDVRIVAADPADVESAVALLDPSRIARLAAFDPVGHVTTPPLWDALVTVRRERGFTAELVAGARSHFAELNRRYDDLPPDAQALTCSLTPQMHATELPHLVDNLAGQAAVARDAVRLAGKRLVHLGPVTLRQRFNAVATRDRRTGPPDPLQPTAFTAAWTVGSLAALSRPGVAGVCYYEAAGPGGIGDAEDLYPVGGLLTAVASLRGRDVLETQAPAGVAVYAVRTADGVRVLLGRLGDSPLPCAVHGPTGAREWVLLHPWSTADVWLP